MGRLNLSVLFAGVAAAAMPAVCVADDAATRQLIEQGHFWEQRDQPERARAAWERVLSVDPKNQEALARLSALSAAAGDSRQAQQYIDRLKAIAPDSPLLGEARRSLAAGPAKNRDAPLSHARELAAARNYTGAVAAYREAFGSDKPPDGPVALEYYQTLGATPDGWAQAKSGLAELVRAHPEDSHYALAYAQHLTYREESRREGIDRLAELSQNGNAAARSAWRQALVWLQARPDDAERYSRYLHLAGGDAEVQKRIDSLRSTGDAHLAAAQGERIKDIYTQIQNDQADAAEQSINALLQSQPRSADAHGALGILRLRQTRYAEAEQLLRQAQSERPSDAGRWRQALASAVFWQHVQKAQTARDANDAALAESEYAEAFAHAPTDAPDALRVAYADVLIERSRNTEAETIDRAVLRRDPANPDALRGLITVLARSGRQAEALQLSEHAPANVQDQLSGLRADQLRARAATERKAGDLPLAQTDLEQALLLAPESPWIRLDLAGVYRAQGHTDQAQSLLDGLAISNGDIPEVHIAQAYAAGERGDWLQALQALELLTPAQRNAEARAEQRRAWVNYQMQRVDAAVAVHQPAEGFAVIGEAADAAGNDPELLAAVAGGWAKLGDPARAVGTMRRAIERSPHAEPGTRIQYAALLLSAGQDGEFEVVADDLATRAILTSVQQQTLDDLVVGYRVKLADRLRTAGNLAEAYVQLRDVISRYPDDARVQMALARLLAASGDYQQSSAIYKALMARKPDDEDATLGLIDSRLSAGDQEGARSLIKAGLRAHPDDPKYWQASGRLAEIENRRGDALEAYRRADLLNGKKPVQTTSDEPPQLAWLDPSRPDQALPIPVAQAVSEVAPSTGPLRPRAAEVALPPTPGATPAPDLPVIETASGLHLAQRLGLAERSTWAQPPVRSPLTLKPALQIGSNDQQRLSANQPPSEAPATSDFDRLAAETSGWVGGAFTTRSRAGQAGLSQLNDLEIPLQWRSREFRYGRLGADVTPVYLDAGSASGMDRLSYGTEALISGTAPIPTSNAAGLAVDLNYSYGPVKADIGTTPLGFLEQRLTGGLKLSLSPGDWRLSAEILRRAITDSLLSYAGEKDSLTGRTWGGVTRTGGHGDVGYDAGRFGLYGNAGFYTLDGENVDSNTELTFGAGVYAHIWRTETQSVTLGLNLTVLSYDKNLSQFTFGEGGYFSPQLFTALTVPIEWTGRRGQFTYQLRGALGIQSFREDGNALYPGFPGLQEELNGLPPGEPTATFARGYSSQRNSGLGYAFGGAGEYRVLSHLSLGGQFGVDNARDYRELQLSGYLRYYFADQLLLTPQAPTPILPLYGQ